MWSGLKAVAIADADEADIERSAAACWADNEDATATDAEDAEAMYAVLMGQSFAVG